VLREELPGLERRGFQRIRIDGQIKRLDDRNVIPEKSKGREISVDIVVDRLRLEASSRSRLADSLELAFKEGSERAIALIEEEEGFKGINLSQSYSCEVCGINYPGLTPRFFSWNHPDGACETCSGLGEVLRFREDLVIQDPCLTLNKGAIKPWRYGSRKMITLRKNILKALSEQYSFDLKVAWVDLPDEVKNFLLLGDDQREFELKLQVGRGKAKKQVFPGVFQDLQETIRNTSSESLRAKLLTCQYGSKCPDCQGGRLSSYARNVKLAGQTMDKFLSLPVGKAWKFIKGKASRDHRCLQVEDALNGLKQRLGFIEQVGLGYLTLDRSYRSLSGGEAQRSRLATQLGWVW